MLPVQSYPHPVMRIQETRPALRSYQSFQTECPNSTGATILTNMGL